jgi:hypothetical protein
VVEELAGVVGESVRLVEAVEERAALLEEEQMRVATAE